MACLPDGSLALVGLVGLVGWLGWVGLGGFAGLVGLVGGVVSLVCLVILGLRDRALAGNFPCSLVFGFGWAVSERKQQWFRMFG